MNSACEFGDIVKQFKFEGEFVRSESYGCGHINDTYLVYFKKMMDKNIDT